MKEQGNNELIRVVKRLSALMYQHIDFLLKPYGLARTQYVILRHLHERGGLATGELLAKLQVEAGTLSGLIDTLEDKGLVKRVERPDDKRRKDVHLTVAGRKLLRDIPPPGPHVERAMLRGIHPRAAATFQLVGGNMIDNLEEALWKEENA